MKLLFVGDIVGQSGVDYTGRVLREILSEMRPDLVIANAENAVRGRGLTTRVAEELYDVGVELITLGNHAFDQREVEDLLEHDRRVIRPANYPPGAAGVGTTLCDVRGTSVLLVNVMGRTFMNAIDCPFQTMDRILDEHKEVQHIIVDMHAETTSEKLAMGWYLDGKVSAVLGTHTHVPTADERLLPLGTAYISDVGMVGPRDGILGMDRIAVIRRFRTQLPTRFDVATGACQFCAVTVELDPISGRAQSIQRIYRSEK